MQDERLDIVNLCVVCVDEAEVVVGLVCSVVQACIVAYEEKPV